MRIFKRIIVPHIAGMVLILTGWYMSLVSVGLDRFTSIALFTDSTLFGLLLIVLGAYLPEIWIAILRAMESRGETRPRNRAAEEEFEEVDE